MTRSVVWHSGERALGYQVERLLNVGSEATGELTVLRDNPRRRIVAVDADGRPVLVKHFRVGSGRHALRERVKAQLGQSQAGREWRALGAMRHAALPVPEPLALGTLADGDQVLVMEFVSGHSFGEWLRAHRDELRSVLPRLGKLVASIHREGWVHGDLHVGNLLVSGRRLVLIDWQHAARTRAEYARREDRAHLEHSLARRLSLPQRMRFREAALGIERPSRPGSGRDETARAALRGAGAAVAARYHQHARSRTRRALRPGRLYAPVALRDQRGLRTRDLSERELGHALEQHRAALTAADDPRVIKNDARSKVTQLELGVRRLIVKETPWRGLARALADALRGSPGQRAWLGGHGLRARRVGAALPYAFLETRWLGLPARSWVVLEDLRPAWEAAFAVERGHAAAAEVTDALVALLIRMHRREIDHGDLKGTHILLRRVLRQGSHRLEPFLIDLEGVRFRTRLRARQRLRALAELNASLPDNIPTELRCRAWLHYCRALGWPAPRDRLLERVVRESLARNHRWSGRGCALSPRAQ